VKFSRIKPLIVPPVAILSVVLLSGCSLEQGLANRDPQTSDLVLDETSMPEINQIKVPMPAATRTPVLKRADGASLWRISARSLFTDQRAEKVGDILSVVIDINDKAQLANASERSRSGSEKTDSPTFFGYGGQIYKALPGIDAADLPTSGQIVDLGSTSANAGKGTIKRNESIQLKVAAMLILRLPNGNFVVAGRQEVKVNSELRELRVAGIIRPEDVTSANTITYDKIAEARITYGGRGQISQVQPPRYGANFLDIILPY
jgi:flagellar L-ring protein FlgH